MNKELYRISNHVIDKVTGFNIKKALRESIFFDHLDREQILQYQKQRFKLLSKIAAKSEYYKNYKGTPLSDYPLMTRENFARLYPTLITKHGKPFFSRRSTGSTGVTVTHNITREMLLAKRVSHQKMLYWYGLTRESPEMKIGGEPASFLTTIYYQLKNKRYVNSYQISDKDINRIIRKYNKFRPKILYGYPSVLNFFVMKSQLMGIELHQPDLIVTHAENLYQEIKDRLTEHFPESKIANQYWSTEACIAETCPEGNLHINEDTVICEVLYQDNDGVGNLFITNLFSYVVPYIRYQIGDRIKLSDVPCKCGRSTQVIDMIQGRDIELIDLPDGRKYPVTALHYSQFTENMLAHQLLYDKKNNKVIIRYVPVNEHLPVMRKEMSEYWKDQFNIKAEFEQVSALKHSAGGKFKRLINVA